MVARSFAGPSGCSATSRTRATSCRGSSSTSTSAARSADDLPYLYRAVTNRCLTFLRDESNRARLLERNDASLRPAGAHGVRRPGHRPRPAREARARARRLGDRSADVPLPRRHDAGRDRVAPRPEPQDRRQAARPGARGRAAPGPRRGRRAMTAPASAARRRADLVAAPRAVSPRARSAAPSGRRSRSTWRRARRARRASRGSSRTTRSRCRRCPLPRGRRSSRCGGPCRPWRSWGRWPRRRRSCSRMRGSHPVDGERPTLAGRPREGRRDGVHARERRRRAHRGDGRDVPASATGSRRS